MFQELKKDLERLSSREWHWGQGEWAWSVQERLGPNDFTDEGCQTFKEEITPIQYKNQSENGQREILIRFMRHYYSDKDTIAKEN